MMMNDGHRRRPGWAPFLEPGRRVVLRYAIDRTSSPHGESMTDALGTILEVDQKAVDVMTRRGRVTVPRTLMVASKEVPPPPPRRQPVAQPEG
ncbi:acetyltransferase [Brachybacterium sp. Marseille-Q2903]|uniref:Acetyltransferase n=1 Tax=Brachybacterium epidermidis TaxID=2781983 RepID=A0ABR9W2N6_9MICO|nr:acetyltransferase [Brachybacterium epidermidis]